jgi:hypothetical protein
MSPFKPTLRRSNPRTLPGACGSEHQIACDSAACRLIQEQPQQRPIQDVSMKINSLRTANDRWCPTPRGTLAEAVADALLVDRIGAAKWHGRCEICCTDDTFTLQLTDYGMSGRCSACDGAHGRFLWLLLKLAAADRRAGR